MLVLWFDTGHTTTQILYETSSTCLGSFIYSLLFSFFQLHISHGAVRDLSPIIEPAQEVVIVAHISKETQRKLVVIVLFTSVVDSKVFGDTGVLENFVFIG